MYIRYTKVFFLMKIFSILSLHCARKYTPSSILYILKNTIYKIQSERIYAISFACFILRVLNISYKRGILHPIFHSPLISKIRDIFIRYKLKFKKEQRRKEKKNLEKKRRRVKKREIYRRRNISTIALSSVWNSRYQQPWKLLTTIIGSAAKQKHLRIRVYTRARVCSVDIPVKLEFLSSELQYPVMHIVLNRTQ